MRPVPHPDCPEPLRISDSVPMLYVSSVDRSSEFYALLGFSCLSRFSGPEGITNWSRLSSGRAQLMLARASGTIRAEDQAVLLYMYSDNAAGLREHLLNHGIADGGVPDFEGKAPPAPQAPAVFTVVPRFYMPAGELRIHDPDGYCLLVGQLD